MRFWKNVQSLLKRRRMSLRGLAREVGVSAPALSNYGKGAMPGLDVAVRIADALQVPLEWLVRGDVDQPPPGACPNPQEHVLYQEVVKELGLDDLVRLSRMNTLDVAVRIHDIVGARHPAPVPFEELRALVAAPSTDVLEDNLFALKSRGLIGETTAQDGRRFSLLTGIAHFVSREPTFDAMHLKTAVRLLCGEIRPLLERDVDAGHLLTVKGSIPRHVAEKMVRELHETVKSRCREDLANDGETGVYLVFGVAAGGNAEND